VVRCIGYLLSVGIKTLAVVLGTAGRVGEKFGKKSP